MHICLKLALSYSLNQVLILLLYSKSKNEGQFGNCISVVFMRFC